MHAFWEGFFKEAGLVNLAEHAEQAAKNVVKKVESHPPFVGQVAPKTRIKSEYEKIWDAHDAAKARPQATLDYSKGRNGDVTYQAPGKSLAESKAIAQQKAKEFSQKRLEHVNKSGYTEPQMVRAGKNTPPKANPTA